eukprot:TRINITY_DN1764_c0_g1_i1.p1 TRINITY_DN1764_c0_g1~~TRINITY_DN1764_c0_g1_i1.p1  ORF type:complete len:104 (-),score=19.23 TRINITY_DN1764_c0_g1_i1:553-864(-)
MKRVCSIAQISHAAKVVKFTTRFNEQGVDLTSFTQITSLSFGNRWNQKINNSLPSIRSHVLSPPSPFALYADTLHPGLQLEFTAQRSATSIQLHIFAIRYMLQ